MPCIIVLTHKESKKSVKRNIKSVEHKIKVMDAAGEMILSICKCVQSIMTNPYRD